MERRTLFKAMLAFTLGGGFISATAMKPKKIKINHHIDDLIFDQSGSYGNGAFVMGTFSTNGIHEMVGRAENLRKKLRYRCTLTHASRNKWKQKYACALIDMWMASPDAKMNIFIVKEDPCLASAKSSEKLSRYTELVSRLIDASQSEKRSNIRLVTQAHFKADRQAKYEKMLTSRNVNFKEVAHISESQSDLLQLVDLVVGAIQANQKTTNSPVENAMKQSVFEHLRKKLRVKTLQQTIQHPRCSITYV